MRIAPAVPAPWSMNPSTPGAGGTPVDNFADLLGSRAGADRADRFDGLGVFGRAAATPAPATSILPRPEGELSEAVRPAATEAPRPSGAIGFTPGPGEAPAGAAPPGASVSASARRGTPPNSERNASASSIDGFAADADAAEPRRKAADEAPSTPRSRAATTQDDRRRPDADVRQRVALELTDPMGAAVAVSGASLTSDEAERFRARAETLLRVHGLTLRALTDRGALAGPSPLPERILASWR